MGAVMILITGAVMGFMFCMIVNIQVVPGYFKWLIGVWLGKNDMYIDFWGDGYAEFVIGKKDRKGQLTHDIEGDMVVDKSAFDTSRNLSLEGRRVFLRFRGSAMSAYVKGLPNQAAALRHVKDNPQEYPWMSGLANFRILGLLTHDPVILEEVVAKYCLVSANYVDPKTGDIKTMSTEQMKAETLKIKKERMGEVLAARAQVKFEPLWPCYIDVGELENATQLRITSQVLSALKTDWITSALANISKPENTKFIIYGAIGALIVMLGFSLAFILLNSQLHII